MNNCKYTQNNKELIFNNCRQKAFLSFEKTLDSLYGKDNITEIEFQKEWLKNLEQEENVIADGWYNPPPYGMAVLFGDRVSFDSLRNEDNWPKDIIIDWKKDLMYAYCSPVDKQTGIIGDMSITLYFGKDKRILNHMNNCHKAVKEIFDNLNNIKDSYSLFDLSERIFEKHKLKNCVVSKTDNTPLDLGHTFPRWENVKDKLEDEDIKMISKSRKFINKNTNWEIKENMQFTIEPQLISTEDTSLPQISQHYLIQKNSDDYIICNDIDEIIQKTLKF